MRWLGTPPRRAAPGDAASAPDGRASPAVGTAWVGPGRPPPLSDGAATPFSLPAARFVPARPAAHPLARPPASGGFPHPPHASPAPDMDAAHGFRVLEGKVAGMHGMLQQRAEEADRLRGDAKGHWIVDTPISNPMSGYPLYKGSRKSWGIDALGSMVVEVELTNGMVGVGISIGGEPGCYIVEHHLARFAEGQDPRNIELIWDQMHRATINYGRKGLPIQALSAVDLALWDALGKLRGEPVYQLLGGKTKDRLPIYATTARPDLAKEMGFVQAKFPLPYGPGDGDAGMRKNIWIEEHLHPDDYDGYAEVRSKVGHLNLFTCGEHEYTRYGFRQLLERKCCDVLQPDITWCGGITEARPGHTPVPHPFARRVCAMAAAYDIPVIPHGNSPTLCPLPSGGYIDLDPSKPGFGVTLDKEAVPLRRPYARTNGARRTRESLHADAAKRPAGGAEE
eukprot:gene8935-50187_t